MKQAHRVVSLVLALVLLGMPALVLAQTSSRSGTTKSSPGASGSGTSTTSPSASPGTGSGSSVGSSGSSSSSTMMPTSKADCMNDGWKKFGLKSEAECTSKVK